MVSKHHKAFAMIQRIFITTVKYIQTHPQIQYVLLGGVLFIIGRGILFGDEPSNVDYFIQILIYSIVALGLNLLLGFSGLISLATASFMGISTYGMYFLMNTFDMNYFVAAVIVLVFASLVGLLVGVLSLKMQGIYLAIATLFVAHIIGELFRSFQAFNYGESTRINEITFFGDVSLSAYAQEDRLYLMGIVVLGFIFAFIVIHNIVKSPSGRAFMAISRSYHAALAMGISVRRYRLLAFMIATVFAAFGGILYLTYMQSTGSVSRMWNLELSLILLAIVVVGGLKSLPGMLLGATIIIGIPEFVFEPMENFFQGFGPLENISLRGFDDIFTGLLIILTILYYPYGAVHFINKLKGWMHSKYHQLKRSKEDESHE